MNEIWLHVWDWLPIFSLKSNQKEVDNLTLLKSELGVFMNGNTFWLKKKVSYIFLIMLLTLKESVLLLPKFYAPYIRREYKIKTPNNVRYLSLPERIYSRPSKEKKISHKRMPKWISIRCILNQMNNSSVFPQNALGNLNVFSLTRIPCLLL